MKIDKENSEVAFCEETHKYWVKNSNDDLISVTTLIEKFGQPFDKEFWSKTKALQELLGEQFNEVKLDIYKTKKIPKTLLKKYNIQEKQLIDKQLEILKKWEQTNKEACERGTKIHKERELSCLDNATSFVQQYSHGGSFIPITTNAIIQDKDAVYPEILLHYISNDGKLKVAGQADLVMVEDNIVYIHDYKTNKEIKLHSYMDPATKQRQMMRYPLNHLEDTNYWHYAMQLSTYAWMIQKANPEFKIGKLRLIHYSHDDKETVYEVPYLKGEVEVMLQEYKRQLTTKEAYDKLKPIEY